MTTARLWGMCLLLIGLALLPFAGVAQGSDHLIGADEIIARADATGAQKDYDGAVSLLKSALDRYPSYAPLYLSLANWQEARGRAKLADQTPGGSVADAQFLATQDAKDLFNTFGLATIYLPDPQAIRQRARQLIGQTFPTQLGEYGPLVLPGNPSAFTFTLSDPRLPVEERGTHQGLTTTTPLPVDPNDRDPKYGKDHQYDNDPTFGGLTFQHVLYAYGFDNDQSWHLRFRVFWQDVPGKEDERAKFAQLVGRMYIQLAETMHAYTGLWPKFSDDGVVNVWLTEKGQPGGEAYNDSIYIYNIDTPRSGEEWVRELAHEYGHLALPAMGGYTDPEWSATGRLGERLLLRWLMLNPDTAQDTHPWVTEIDPSEVNGKRIYPFIRKFANIGPNAPALRGTNLEAMDDFIGMALYIEQSQGSRFLSSAMKGMLTPSFAGSNGFRESVENSETFLQNVDSPIVTLRLADLPLDIPYHVYLLDGTWKGQLIGQDFQPSSIKLTMDGKTVSVDGQGKFALKGVTNFWHVFRIIPIGGAKSPELTVMTLTQ